MSKPTEVYIGRTGESFIYSKREGETNDSVDYHISIHKSPSNRHRMPVQNLSFSAYGPNNQDTALQAAYRNTKDDSYIQSLPSGEIMFFKAKRDAIQAPESSVLWAYQFEDPMFVHISFYPVLSKLFATVTA